MAWAPSDLAGIAIWLRADDIAGADGVAVSSWLDRIASKNFAQATGSKQPLRYTTTSARLIGGQPVVTFDGVDDILRYAGTTSPSSGHVILVARILAMPGTNLTSDIYASCDEASTTRFFKLQINDNSGTTQNFATRQRNNDTTDNLEGSTTDLNVGDVHVLEASSDSSTVSIKVDGVDQSILVNLGVNNGDWIADATARDSITIGASKTTSESLWTNIDIAEIIEVDGSNISAAERGRLDDYLSDRYSIDIQPRASAPPPPRAQRPDMKHLLRR